MPGSVNYLHLLFACPFNPVKTNPYNTNNLKTTARGTCQAAYICDILPEIDFKEDKCFVLGIFTTLLTVVSQASSLDTICSH